MEYLERIHNFPGSGLEFCREEEAAVTATNCYCNQKALKARFPVRKEKRKKAEGMQNTCIHTIRRIKGAISSLKKKLAEGSRLHRDRHRERETETETDRDRDTHTHTHRGRTHRQR